MNYIQAENLSRDYGERILFDKLTFGISKGDKTALIANNGAGKSSLLKILVGKDTPDQGTVVIKEGLKIGYLEQEPDFSHVKTIKELITGSNSSILEIIKEYEKSIVDNAENYSPATERRATEAAEKMDLNNAWDYERRLEQILTLFQITDHSQTIESLSGGQKKRLALALTLLDNPDLLVLDEPTNHLDVEMIEWLEKYLSQNGISVLMVTHDRYFLDRVCTHILELYDEKMYHHKGNYNYFLEKREEREENFQVEIEKAGKLLKKELEWMRRMPKARTTKAKSRINAFYDTEKKASGRKKVQELRLEVKMSRLGGKILEMKNVSKKYGDKKIINNFNYTFKKGDKIGIIGKNGVGKSTFLNIITELESADSGEITTGDTIVYGYYSQKGINLKEDKRVLDVLTDIAEVIELADGSQITASQFLTQFMFPPKVQHSYVSKLSGGEKRRLYLLTVLIKNPNFLILDEPTNDLDLLTLNKLEEFLQNYNGCVLIVSHDRYFMDKLVEELFVFEGEGEITSFLGNYTEYRDDADEREEAEKEQVTKTNKIEEKISQKPSENKAKKLSFKEKFEYDNLESEIKEIEVEKEGLEKKISISNTPYEEIVKASTRIAEIIELIDVKYFRRMELEEKMN